MSKTDLEIRMKEKDVDLPEDLVINIFTRLPMQSIVRFKLVCREWKTLAESGFFQQLYKSISNSTSSNWPILHGCYKGTTSCLEEVRLNLPHESSSQGNSHNWSFTSEVIRKYTQTNNKIKEIWVVSCADGLVLLRLHGEDVMKRYYIGNPVLPQWIQLPLPPYLPQYHLFMDSGLVTRMDNGVLLGYKVVQMYVEDLNMAVSPTRTFHIYSSNTREWRVQHVSFPGHGLSSHKSNPISLNGKLHWFDEYREKINVHDFFSHDDQVQVISLPNKMIGTQCESRSCINTCPSPCYKMVCTTSRGYFVLIEAGLIDEVKSYNVKVWRLNSDSWNWETVWEINMACVGLSGFNCVPMAINYFDIDIIYLWDLDRKCFIACNLRTHTKSYGNRKHEALYKEDTLCFEKHSCLSQFVPSFQVVPS